MASLCVEFLEDLQEERLRESETVPVEPCETPPPPPTPTNSKSTTPPAQGGNTAKVPEAEPCGSKLLKPHCSKKAIAKALFPGAHQSPVKKRGVDKKARAARGTAGTFAGRRPPKDPVKLEQYQQMQQDYLKLRGEITKSGSKITVSQETYWAHMRQALEKQKVGNGQDRFRAAARAYRGHIGL